jgi:hypothetical protein
MWFVRFAWGTLPRMAFAAVSPVSVYRSEDGNEGCAYFDSYPSPVTLSEHLSLVRLRCLQVIEGAAFGRNAPWHYVVATDVRADEQDDFIAWYDQEHLPGLAAVPGTVRAARYRVVEGAGPQYHACYDLADRSAFNSPEWLAVRATPWSSRVRPAFVNTRRTMYRRVDPAASLWTPG